MLLGPMQALSALDLSSAWTSMPTLGSIYENKDENHLPHYLFRAIYVPRENSCTEASNTRLRLIDDFAEDFATSLHGV